MTPQLQIAVTPWRLAEGDASSGLAEQAEIAEKLGFHSFWLPEHHFGGPASIPAPLMLLAAVASRTQRIRLGTTSFLLPIRQPILAAAEVAVLDQISMGRVILGVGRGFRRAMLTTFGVSVGEKRAIFESALNTMRSAWRGEPLQRLGPASSDASTEEPIRLAPLPFQRPHPPIWIAAFGPKAVRQAGRLGLPYLASPIESLAALEANYASHREALEEAGNETPADVPVMRTMFASRSAETLARVREALAKQAAALAKSPLLRLREAANRDLGEWALVGEPAEVADGIARYRERLGVTLLIARTQIPGVDARDCEASLELLAESGGPRPS